MRCEHARTVGNFGKLTFCNFQRLIFNFWGSHPIFLQTQSPLLLSCLCSHARLAIVGGGPQEEELKKVRMDKKRSHREEDINPHRELHNLLV